MKRINVAIVGIGNCAKSLVEGVQYYTQNQDDVVGLMYEDIGGYKAENLQFVVGFDVDVRKINKPLGEALREKPNCAMDHVKEIDFTSIHPDAQVYQVPVMDGVDPRMLDFHENVTFKTEGLDPAKSLTREQIIEKLKATKVDVLINYLPVGSEEATRFWVDICIDAGVNMVNCIPTLISTEDMQEMEQKFIDAGLIVVGSDMRSAWGASRLSEVLQGAMLDSGLIVTQHIQTNMASGSTQGHEHIRTGRTANTDFLNLGYKERLKNKHISKENVLAGQSVIRDCPLAGTTMFAGPSLTVQQRPGGEYLGSDNKIANLDIVGYGFGGARYELTARLSVQDSPNSGGVVVSAIRFCQVAAELGLTGFLRGPSHWTNKTPPLQLKTADAKFECDALARRIVTPLNEAQLKVNKPVAKDLPYTFQKGETEYKG